VGYCPGHDGVRIVVCDGGGRTAPQLRGPSQTLEGGRGLQIVGMIAAAWGEFRVGQAQVVWCDLGMSVSPVSGHAWAWLTAVLATVALAAPEPVPVRASRL